MLRKTLTILAGAAAVTGALGFAAHDAKADTVTLRVATIAPAESPWGKVFKAWQKGVKEATHGGVEVQFFYGNQQGGEEDMVKKIKARQLDGAAITAGGLGAIYKSALIFQMPGMFSSWDTLDAARKQVRPELEAEFTKLGFKILGWGDVGQAKLMTKGYEAHSPKDLKHKNTFFFSGDPIESTFFTVVGDITPKQLSIPEVLPALTSNTINTVNAPALAAEQLQWSSMVDHMNVSTSGFGIGAMVLSAQKLDSLPADMKQIVNDTGANASEMLTASIRKQDDQAFARLKAHMTTYEPSAAEKEEWKKVFEQTRTKLRGAAFDAHLYDEVTKLAGVK